MNNFKFKKFIVPSLLIIIIFSFLFFQPKRAYALVPVIDAANLAANEATAASTGSLLAKETIADTAAWLIAKGVLAAMTQSIVNWINSGLEGNPTFVQNPQQFFGDAANQAGGVFIQQLGLTRLCSSSWLPRLKLALQYNMPYLQRMQCTPEMVATNIENFTNDFTNGGWDSWLSMTAYPQNNIWGAYFESSDELARRQAAAASRAQMEVSWGQGFVSLKECEGGGFDQETTCDTICANSTENYDDIDDCFNECMADEMSTTELCDLTGGQMQNTTPGNLIAEQITTALGSPFRQLEIADEIEEMLGAIFNALVNQLISTGLGSMSL